MNHSFRSKTIDKCQSKPHIWLKVLQFWLHWAVFWDLSSLTSLNLSLHYRFNVVREFDISTEMRAPKNGPSSASSKTKLRYFFPVRQFMDYQTVINVWNGGWNDKVPISRKKLKWFFTKRVVKKIKLSKHSFPFFKSEMEIYCTSLFFLYNSWTRWIFPSGYLIGWYYFSKNHWIFLSSCQKLSTCIKPKITFSKLTHPYTNKC